MPQRAASLSQDEVHKLMDFVTEAQKKFLDADTPLRNCLQHALLEWHTLKRISPKTAATVLAAADKLAEVIGIPRP